MAEPVLLVEKRDAIATLTLNRPDKMNALSYELRKSLADELEDIKNDRGIEVVIITGAGRAFCAGLDLKEMGDAKTRGQPLLDPPGQLRTLPQPVIGAINGVAVTGGFELVTSCDVVIGSTAARFADTHARLGIVAGWGLSQRLPRLIGLNRAKELAVTGNYMSAELAYEWGLLNRVVEPEELMPTCYALAKDITSCVPATVQTAKRLIESGFTMSLGDGMQLEQEINHNHRGATAEEIAARRDAVQSRGRSQSS